MGAQSWTLSRAAAFHTALGDPVHRRIVHRLRVSASRASEPLLSTSSLCKQSQSAAHCSTISANTAASGRCHSKCGSERSLVKPLQSLRIIENSPIISIPAIFSVPVPDHALDAPGLALLQGLCQAASVISGQTVAVRLHRPGRPHLRGSACQRGPLWQRPTGDLTAGRRSRVSGC